MKQAQLERKESLPANGPTGFEHYRRSAKSGNRKFIAVGAIIALAAVAIVYAAMQGSSVYYLSVADFNTKQVALAGDKEIRVAGKVVPGTIAKDERTRGVSFVAMDKDKPEQTIKVAYSKLPPDTFKDEAEVVVTGTYNNGIFTANEMLAKCPSKYSSQATDAK